MKWDNDKYLAGADGFFSWVEDNVHLQVYRPKSLAKEWLPFSRFPTEYLDMWENQKEVLREALVMNENGEFRHRLIIFMWPRGEGKSVLCVLLHLWRFTTLPSQKIILGANSIGQIRFMHFDEMVSVLTHSPRLLHIVGKQNMQQKEIRMKDHMGGIASFIRPVSSFTGIYSGATGYSFSEFHQAKNYKFFTEIDSSMRGVKSGLGVIDTTVAPKSHILYKLYKNFLSGADKTIYFSYRTTSGKAEEFWNPQITQEYLDTQKVRLAFGEYERFFINSWDAGTEKMFSEVAIEATNYLGTEKRVDNQQDLFNVLEKKVKIFNSVSKISKTASNEVISSQIMEVQSGYLARLESRLWPVSAIYTLDGPSGEPSLAPVDALNVLGDLYNTNWAILVGLDRADPMKQGKKTAARTILSCVAKGLPGSKTNPFIAAATETDALSLNYIYLLMGLFHIEDSSVGGIETKLREMVLQYNGIDSFGSERWGALDMGQWFDENEIKVNIYHPNYAIQRTIFGEVYRIYAQGRFKTPPIPVPGSKGPDILKEEAAYFDHDPESHLGKFGSPEKKERFGVQDDAIFSLANAIYGGFPVGPSDFRERKGAMSFGFVFLEDTYGKY